MKQVRLLITISQETKKSVFYKVLNEINAYMGIAVGDTFEESVSEERVEELAKLLKSNIKDSNMITMTIIHVDDDYKDSYHESMRICKAYVEDFNSGFKSCFVSHSGKNYMDWQDFKPTAANIYRVAARMISILETTQQKQRG